MKVVETVPENVARVGRKTTVILFAAQSLTSASGIATAAVLSILGEQLSGSAAWSGLPSAAIQLAGAPFAYLWGVAWDRTGRRSGLSLGLVLGLVGMAVAVTAIQGGSMWLFLLGLVGLGGSGAAVQLARFIAAEVNPPAARGRAISYVVLGGSLGAVGGPLLVSPSSRWAQSAGLPETAGPFVASLALFVAAILITWLGLRPEPMAVSRQVAALFPEREQVIGSARTMGTLLRLPGVFVAVAAMVLSPMVMNLVTAIISLYMKDNRLTLGNISWVFSMHALGMFAFSVVAGKLADSWGRGQVILAGSILMIAALMLAPISTAIVPLVVALFLLGLGWNLCFIGGSALLADHLTPNERSRTQGFNDLLIGLVTAVGSLGSGVIFAGWGFLTLTMVGAAFLLVLLAITLWWRFTSGAGLQLLRQCLRSGFGKDCRLVVSPR